MRIAICIPTYKRPDLLKQAISSCFTQTRLPDEILIGDDSPNMETEDLIRNLNLSSPVCIRYFHNQPSLKQVANVNTLFDKVEADLTVLLHDDDTLVNDALSNLEKCFIDNPDIDIAFGKQYIMSNEGVVDQKASEELNKDFYRTSNYQGIVLSSLESGFLQQFPNDCYMIKSEIVKRIQYRNNTGDGCDFDFGLQLGLKGLKMFFLNKYTANYRISAEAISTGAGFDAGLVSYQSVKALEVPRQSLKLKEECLRKKAPMALIEAAKLKKPGKAFEIYFSKWHRKNIFTLGGIKRFLLMLYYISKLVVFKTQ